MSEEMKSDISLERDGLNCTMKVVVPTKVLTKQVNKKMQKLQLEIKLDGYRPGKVPAHVINKRFGRGVLEEEAGKLMQESFEDALKQKKLDLAGQPQVDMPGIELGSDLKYTVKFECYPEVELVDFSKCVIDKLDPVLSDVEFDDSVKKLSESYPDWEEKDGVSAQGDRLLIDYVGKIDAEEFPGGTASDYHLRLGKSHMPSGFEDNLLKKKAGTEHKFKLTYPRDYHVADLCDKTADFEVTIKQIHYPKLLPLNEELVKRVGGDSKTVEEFRNELKESMQNEAQQLCRRLQRDRVIDLFKEKHDFELPNGMLQDEFKGLIEHRGKFDNVDVSADKKEEEAMLSRARDNIKATIIMRNLINELKIKLDERKVYEYINSLAVPYVDKSVFIKWYTEDENRMHQARAVVLEQQVIDAVMDKLQTNLQQHSLTELKAMIDKLITEA